MCKARPAPPLLLPLGCELVLLLSELIFRKLQRLGERLGEVEMRKGLMTFLDDFPDDSSDDFPG